MNGYAGSSNHPPNSMDDFGNYMTSPSSSNYNGFSQDGRSGTSPSPAGFSNEPTLGVADQQGMQAVNPAWMNALPPQQTYPNNLGGMPAFFSQQVFHDALALSYPVEPADEPVLVKTLAETRSRGVTYKDALNGLHGTGGHSATLWKDYYLDNKDRLDLAIQAYGPPKKTIKKPSIATFKTEPSPQASSAFRSSSPVASSSSSRVNKRRKPNERTRRSSESSHRATKPAPRGRSTINSMTVHVAEFNPRLPPPNTELRIPEPPSRSPTPPTELIPHARGGHKFTLSDRKFFINFIGWRLKDDPTLTRLELCELLAEKAPHHSSQSWASYWSGHHDLPDKILTSHRRQAEEAELKAEEEESENSNEGGSSRRRRKYEEPDSGSELTESENEEEEVDEESDDEDVDIPAADISQMGPKGGSYTQADMAVVARHVATFPDFLEVGYTERWRNFAPLYPQRTMNSWNEYYKRNSKQIDKIAKKIRSQCRCGANVTAVEAMVSIS